MPTSPPKFSRTLPLFDQQDREVIQKILNSAVNDLEYDHPDRKIARDLYHKVREGEAIRLHIDTELDGLVLIIDSSETRNGNSVNLSDFVDEFVDDVDDTADGTEWKQIAKELQNWHTGSGIDEDEIVIGFEYLH